LRIGLQHSWESVVTRKKDTEKGAEESRTARKWFTNLAREADEGRGAVERVDVEGVPVGIEASA
jgi:ketosteroid isomerase-like protein